MTSRQLSATTPTTTQNIAAASPTSTSTPSTPKFFKVYPQNLQPNIAALKATNKVQVINATNLQQQQSSSILQPTTPVTPNQNMFQTQISNNSDLLE